MSADISPLLVPLRPLRLRLRRSSPLRSHPGAAVGQPVYLDADHPIQRKLPSATIWPRCCRACR